MDKAHWSKKKERGNTFFLSVTAVIVKYCPNWIVHIAVVVVVSYFFISAKKQRQNIAEYQENLANYFPQSIKPHFFNIWRQFYQFGVAITDRFAVWQRKINYQDLQIYDPDHVYEDIRLSVNEKQKGKILVCSHLGNIDICRALVVHNQNFVLNVLVHSAHAAHFNQALKKAGASDINLIQVSDLNMDMMLDLQSRLEKGQWLAIAADRTPIHGEKTSTIDFLGKKAELPQGPWLLASILKTASISIFCYKSKGKYQLHLKRLFDTPQVSRKNRPAYIQNCTQSFARELEIHCQKAPFQWFNFYQFWKQNEKTQ